MKVTVLPIVIGSLGMLHKGLVKVIEDQEIRRQYAIKNTGLLISARIQRRGLETSEDLLSLSLQ